MNIMERFNTSEYELNNLISVRLRIDYENSNNKRLKCEIHSSNNLSSYCRQCKLKVCLQCEKKHDKHERTNSSDIVFEKIDNISNLIKKFCCIKSDINDVISQCDRQRSTIYKDQKAALDIIDSVFADLHHEIERLKNDLLMELNQVMENCLNRLDCNKVELAALIDDVSSITDLVGRENSAFQNHDLFELEEYTNQKFVHYTETMPLEHLRPNELNIQVKWTDNIKNLIKQPLAKINCHLSPEKLSHIKTVVTCHTNDKRNSYINSMCCDQNNVIYLCDTANNKIKVLNKNYFIDKCFVGSGKHKLIFPSTLMSLPASSKSTNDKNSATVIVSDPGSQNVVAFNQNGQGVDLFVTNGSSSSMCVVSHLSELENLHESFLELSPIYSSMDNFESEIDSSDQQAIVLCTKLDNLYLEFLQINPITMKLYKSRPDMTLALMDSGYSSLPNCMTWNCVSKYLFLLDSHEHKVLIFSGHDGRFIRCYGRFGAGNEEFNEPTNILVDKDGFVLISDMLNNRIHVLDSMGNFLRFLFPFSHKQPVCNPTAMCFDNDNNLLICEKSGKMKIYSY